jgi:hypothetical protein
MTYNEESVKTIKKDLEKNIADVKIYERAVNEKELKLK